MTAEEIKSWDNYCELYAEIASDNLVADGYALGVEVVRFADKMIEERRKRLDK